MADITEIKLEIKAVQFALASFTHKSNETKRQKYLRHNLDNVQKLDTYFNHSLIELKSSLSKLQDILLVQQQGGNAGGPAGAQQGITELYNAFLNAEEKDGMMKLKDSHGKSLNFVVENHDTLIVRKADKHLWRLFSRVVLDGECVDGDAFEMMLVLGPEGIGKSWCSMYFLLMAIKKGHTVVYESVEQGQTWVFSKNGSRIIGEKLQPKLAPELESQQTLHIFDAQAGPDCYEINRVVGGAKQIVFSSTNRTSYAQVVRGNVFQALLPSTSKEEFDKYVSLFGTSTEKVEKVVRVSGYGKVRPLKSFKNHLRRVNAALEEFEVRKLRASTTSENSLSGCKNPAILLDALSPADLDEGEQDLKTICDNYAIENAVWNFSSDFIVDEVFSKFGTEADKMVESLYFALGSDYNRTFGPAIGRLFEKCAVKSGFITRHGLVCRSVDETGGGEQVMFTIGKGCKVQECASDKRVPLCDVVKDCTDATVIYNFAKSNEGFDCFIPPNNFVGFTEVKAKNHPILLSFALECCELIEGPVHYITAVPAAQTTGWGEQSFKINVKKVVKEINKNSKKHISKGGQRRGDGLPSSVQTKLEPFRQFVGSLVTKRTICSSAMEGGSPPPSSSSRKRKRTLQNVAGDDHKDAGDAAAADDEDEVVDPAVGMDAKRQKIDEPTTTETKKHKKHKKHKTPKIAEKQK